MEQPIQLHIQVRVTNQQYGGPGIELSETARLGSVLDVLREYA